MKTSIISRTLILTVVFLTFQGCYTQLATYTTVEAESPPTPEPYPEMMPEDNLTEYHTDTDINEYHYYVYDDDHSCYSDCPDHYDTDYYFSIQLGNSWYWDRHHTHSWRWAWRHGYWDYPYYSDFYYDPYYYHHGWGYTGYWAYYPYYNWHHYDGWGHSGHWAHHPWHNNNHNYYGDSYYNDPPDQNKRGWNRRGGAMSDRNIDRPGQSDAPSGNNSGNRDRPPQLIAASSKMENTRTVTRSRNNGQTTFRSEKAFRKAVHRPSERKDIRQQGNKNRRPTIKTSNDYRNDPGSRTVISNEKKSKKKKRSGTIGRFATAIIEHAINSSGSDKSHKKGSKSTNKKGKNKSKKSGTHRSVSR